jgi:hypothetical protein
MPCKYEQVGKLFDEKGEEVTEKMTAVLSDYIQGCVVTGISPGEEPEEPQPEFLERMTNELHSYVDKGFEVGECYVTSVEISQEGLEPGDLHYCCIWRGEYYWCGRYCA